ncbi:MAG: hypothetical protein ACOYOA_12550 [Saprospiraceae bacterium]
MRSKATIYLIMQLSAVLLLCTAMSCSTIKVSRNQPFQLDKTHSIVLCDSVKASELIITDNTDQIFDKITVTDMLVQMKRNFGPEYQTKDIFDAYVTFLQRDVTNFTPDEMVYVVSAMKEAKRLCDAVSPNIFPPVQQMIKTRSLNYGDGVYYTRENCILIPANVLKKQNKEDFLSVMIHEIFHVYSRQNPLMRQKLYELIGFRHLEANAALEISEPLKSRILLNPDGTDYRYYINLKLSDEQEIKAIPIIYSKSPMFNPKMPAFFNYLTFEMFEIKPINRGYVVATNKEGGSTLNLKDIPDFSRQIRDNTNYIIHPDEILADNFMFLMLSKKDETGISKFSTQGKDLIRQIELILKSN